MENNLKKTLGQALTAIDCLTVYRDIFEQGIPGQLQAILRNIINDEQAAVKASFSLVGRLLALSRNDALKGLDLHKNHFLDCLLEDENPFSLASEKESLEEMNTVLARAVESDLKLLKQVFDLDLLQLLSFLEIKHGLSGFMPSFEHLNSNGIFNPGHPQFYFEKKKIIKQRLAGSENWADCFKDLYSYYREAGSGPFGRYWAFKWKEDGLKDALVGISNPDPIRLGDLVGYEDQKKEILRNTSQFVKGYSANNMLLYGDRGTGKSSTIKGLLHLFGPEGLRLVEVSKHDLLSLSRIIKEIETRAQKFILFIDDLSFEENETQYKELKALLEGSIEKPPRNVLIYATSNRRNLVREFFNDRTADEVGQQDTYQEKLSLADRFGIKLVYNTPDQSAYLKTVKSMAEKSGIDLDEVKLYDLALKWALWQNSRSGRTARQFIDDLKGRLSLNSLSE